MKKQFILSFILFLVSLIAISQDFNNYIPIKSSGEVPEDFRQTSYSKFKAESNEMSTDGSVIERRVKEKFLLQSNYLNDKLLHSGRVIFNDPITIYLNKVGKELLKDNEELRDKIRFYTLKSTVANAYSMNNGIILITTGLLAQLENEAQLAFIMGHEITHYTKKHAINQYVENSKIASNKSDYKELSYDEKIISSLFYSKEDEFEADKESMNDFIAKSKWSLKSIEGIFDVLKYSHLPFDDIAFDTNFLNTTYWKIPSQHWLEDNKKVNKIDDDEETKDDKESTHPNLKRRRVSMLSLMKKFNEDGRSEYVVSENEFKNVQKIARFELSRLFLLDLDYGNALYNSFLLIRDNPESQYLKTNISYSLYGMTKYKNNKLQTKVIKSYNKIEGKSQNLFFMLRKIKNEEMNLVATNYIWKTYLQYPQNPLLKNIAKDIVKELVYKNKISIEDFSVLEPSNDTNTVVKETLDDEKSSKSKKIKKEKKFNKIETKYVLVDLLKNEEFHNMFESYCDSIIDKHFDDDGNEIEINPKLLIKRKKEEKKLRQNGYSLGLSSIIVVDPFVLQYDKTKKDEFRFVGAENNKIKFASMVESNAKKVGLNIAMFDSKTLKPDDSEVFNDMGLMKEWIDETFSHEKFFIYNSSYNEVNELSNRYNTKSIYYTGMHLVKYQKSETMLAVYCVSIPIIFPYLIYRLVKPDYYTEYYGFLFNLEENKLIKSRVVDFEMKNGNDIMNVLLYDEFNQIKRKK